MAKILVAFQADEKGATAIEYALIASFLALAIVASLGNIKTSLIGVFTQVASFF